MARIRGRHTRPELLIRRLLWAEGFRYRLHFRTPGGRADLAFPRRKLAVFVDGCFWHGCPDHYVRPRSSNGFWSDKLRTNVQRDVDQTLRLEEAGWRVCRIWEHEVFEDPYAALRLVRRALKEARWKPGDSWRVLNVVEIDPLRDREKRYMCELRGRERGRTRIQRRSTKKWSARNVQAPQVQE